jgi:hypothetical protein
VQNKVYRIKKNQRKNNNRGVDRGEASSDSTGSEDRNSGMIIEFSKSNPADTLRISHGQETEVGNQV